MRSRDRRQTTAGPHRGISKRFSAALLLAMFIHGDAAAIFGIGDIVFDPTAVAKQIEEFREQAQRWKATAEQYRMQLISVSALNFDQTKLTSKNGALPTVDPDYGIEDACRKKDGDVIGELLSLLRPDPNQEILDQQLEICRRIVRAENTKYNETVRYLNSLASRQRDIAGLDQRRSDVGKEPGKLQALSYDISRYEQSAKMDMDNWQATIVAYDSYIDQLNKYQQRLASRALRGKQPDVVTAAVQGVLLHEALEARKNDD